MDYRNHHKEVSFNRRGGWIKNEGNSRQDPRLQNRREEDPRNSRRREEDPRLNRREDIRNSLERNPRQMYDKLGVPISPPSARYSHSPSPQRDSRNHARRSSERSRNSNSPRRSKDREGWHSPKRVQKQTQMYSQQQPPLPQAYQHAQQPPPMYEQYNSSGYASGVSTYQQGYNQVYGQHQPASGFTQYPSQAGYAQQSSQGYNSGHHQPGPPGEEYPSSWAPVPTAYLNMSQPPPQVNRSQSAAPTPLNADVKKDNLKKEAAIANEMKQQQATLVKQRDDYLRKASVLRRELEKLRVQKHELLSEKPPPRDSQRIQRENAKLQLEIQNKLKSINNVVDMLSGIIGDGLKAEEEGSISPKRVRNQPSRTMGSESDEDLPNRASERSDLESPQFNYIHYDPELHWCRVCDVFPRSAKDLLNHLQSAEHRQVTQEHQLVDTPWHKLPSDPELPSVKGAPVKRMPIKGLQFFISSTSWYCKLCDAWIGDLHCASIHLKSKNHNQNYSNFVEQNPHWETNWIKDREKAFERCAKAKLDLTDPDEIPPAPEPPLINEKTKRKKRKDKNDSPFLDSSKEKKRKKKSKKRKKVDSSGSSSSSSSSDSSSEDDSDKSKSIRVAMRNKMRMQAQLILKEEIGGKLEVLGRLVEEERNRQKEGIKEKSQEDHTEDNIINQWMTVTPSSDKHILENLKGRLKQRQEADREKAMEAAAEQRKKEREREERELKEIREREQREMEEKMQEEQESAERDREEREMIKERERSRRRHHSGSRSPDRFRGRSRSRSVEKRRGHNRGRSQERNYRRSDKRTESNRRSPDSEKFRPKRNFEEERSAYESQFERQAAESAAKLNKGKKSSSSTSTSSHSRKLPFIGRMPLFKKKNDGEEKEIKKEDYDIPRPSKFEVGSSARAFIPEPGVVHITKLSTPPDALQMIRVNAENPPPPPQIIPAPPQISNEEDELAPPPPIITGIPDPEEMVEVQDMDLEDIQAPPLPPGVPVSEAKPLAKPAGNHLPRDFQDALNIIFPGDQRPDQAAATQDPNMMMQYQYGMGYGMMYPGMHMYDYSSAQDSSVPTDGTAGSTTEDKSAPPSATDDDLAMLGIDAEDMAAQTF